jgi:outer membrane protein
MAGADFLNPFPGGLVYSSRVVSPLYLGAGMGPDSGQVTRTTSVEQMAMRQHRVQTACGRLVAVFIFGLAVSASAQSPAVPAARPATPAGAIQPLSIEDAVKMALENNLGLQVQRVNPEMQNVNISLVRSAWLPTLTGSLTEAKYNNPVNSYFSGAADKLNINDFTTAVAVAQALPWGGGNYTLTWNNERYKTNSIYSSPNPSLASDLTLKFTQPLLKNRETDSNRRELVVSKANQQISEIALRQSVLTTIRSVKYAYWNLKSAQGSLRVAQQSLDLAQESLRNNRKRVEVGTMAPIDVVEAEAEVAKREEAVIVAEGTLASAADQLRVLIFKQDRAEYWAIRLEPTDQAVLERRPVDVERAVTTALEKRTDLAQARKNLEVLDNDLKYYKNQTMPELNAVATYGQTGQGGTYLDLTTSLDNPPTTKEGYGKVLDKLFQPDYNNWSVGLTFTYPLGTSSADANAAKARLQRTQQQLKLHELELQVSASVRDIARQVETNWKRLDASGATRRLMERRLESEQKKFAAGLSTNYLVFMAQRDLADAQYSELVAALDYSKSLVDLETVLQSPTAGSSSVSM